MKPQFPIIISLMTGLLWLVGSLSLSAQNISIIGQRTYGGSGDDYGRQLTKLGDGSYLASGEARSPISGDKTEHNRGLHDFWLIRFDSDLNEVWQRTYGGDDIDILCVVEELDDSGDLLVAGSSFSGISGDKTVPNNGGVDFWVLRLDVNGNLIWQQTYGGSQDDHLVGMSKLPDGTLLLGGSSKSGISGDRTVPLKGLLDYWLVCIDQDGQKLWDVSYGGERKDSLSDMVMDTDGSIYLFGNSDSNAGIDKTEDRFGNENIMDGWLVRLDATMNVQWDRTIGGAWHEGYGTVDVGFGSVFTTMLSYSDASGTKSENHRGGGDYWVSCFDTMGNQQWDRTIGGDSNEGFHAKGKLVAHSGLMVFGASRSDASFEKLDDSKGSYDFWPFIVDTSGALVWQATIGGDSLDGTPMDGFELNPGHFLILGSSMSGISGDKTEESRGVRDFWLIEIVTHLGVIEQKPLELSMHPNPAFEHLQIDWEFASTACRGLIELHDASGRTVESRPVSSRMTTIPTGHLPQGIYTVRLTDCNGNAGSERLIKLNR